MKKLVSVLLTLALLATPLLGMAAAAPVTVRFANYALLEAGYESFWNAFQTNFEAANPDIKIEWVTAPYGEIVNQVINMAGGGERVDMIFGEIGWVPTLADSGLSVPTADIFSAEYLADFYPSVMDSFKVDGVIHGLPVYVSPYLLYYNKDIFTKAELDPEAPPATYDELLAMAEKISSLTTDDGNKIYAFGQTTASVPVSGSSLTSFIANFGGQVLAPDGSLSADNPGFKEAVAMLKTLDEKGYNPQNAKLKDLRNLFALGQLAMYYDQSWGFNGVQAINPDARQFTASAAPLKGGQGNGASILQSHMVAFTTGDTEKYDAIRRVTEYLISEEALTLNNYLTEMTPAYPAKNAMSGMEAIANSNVLKGAANSLNNLIVVPAIPRLGDVNLELCTLAQAVTVGGENVDAAIANFISLTQALLDE